VPQSPIDPELEPLEETLSLAIDEADVGQRLDRLLAAKFPDFSRSRWQALIKEGAVQDHTSRVLEDPGHRVKRGDVLAIVLPEATPPEPVGEDIPLTVVFEDAHLIVIDKPAGLVVHPGAGHHTGTLVNALIHHCGDSLSGIGGVKRPGIVHRLDMDTSGLLVVAKTDAAHQGLSAQFQSHGADGRLVRSYSAICWGVIERAKGTVEAALARSKINRTKIAVVRLPAYSTCSWKPAAPTRSACTWRTSTIHCSATPPMVPVSTPVLSASVRGGKWRWWRSTARRCTPACSASSIR
jgi:23S rRNA pseudouridine1911/1915/1917 synthase